MLVTLIKVILISHGERTGTREFYAKAHGSNHCGLHRTPTPQVWIIVCIESTLFQWPCSPWSSSYLLNIHFHFSVNWRLPDRRVTASYRNTLPFSRRQKPYGHGWESHPSQSRRLLGRWG